MTETEARTLTEQIKRRMGQISLLLVEAHEPSLGGAGMRDLGRLR